MSINQMQSDAAKAAPLMRGVSGSPDLMTMCTQLCYPPPNENLQLECGEK